MKKPKPLTEAEWEAQIARVRNAPHGFKHVEKAKLNKMVTAELVREVKAA